MERTLIILKPEVLERRIVGSILSYLDHAGFRLVASRIATESAEKWRVHYDDVLDRIGWEEGRELVKRMARGDCMFAIYEGDSCVSRTRELLGATNQTDAAPGTIRNCFGTSKQFNVMHASDSIQSAAREIKIWFPEQDLVGAYLDQCDRAVSANDFDEARKLAELAAEYAPTDQFRVEYLKLAAQYALHDHADETPQAIRLYRKMLECQNLPSDLKVFCRNRLIFCALSIDDIMEASQAAQSYSHPETCVMIENLLQSYTDYDIDLFTKVVQQLDSSLRLNSTEVTLLLRAKNNINAAEAQ